MKKKKKRKKKKKVWKKIWIGLGLAAAMLLVAGGFFYVDSLAYKVCRVEAGVEVSASDFMKDGDADAFFMEDSEPFDVKKPGEYQVRVKSGYFPHFCTLIIEDTIAPAGHAKEVNLEYGTTCEPKGFVSDIVDATEVIVRFGKEPDFEKTGSQPVQIILVDAGENITKLDTELFVSPVKKDLTREAGGSFPAAENFLIAGGNAKVLTSAGEYHMERVGDYEISLEVDGVTCTSTLHIVDTVPPRFTVHDVAGFALVERDAGEFAESVEDVTEVTFSYAREPDFSLIGTQQVDILATDEGGNVSQASANLTLEEDTESPVLTGVKDMVVYMGDAVSYKKNVNAEDNCPEGLTLEIDNSAVKLKEAGIYPVTYTARDLAGHETSITVNLEVRERMYSEEEVNALADAVLAEILTEDMTPLEKVTAIYNYNTTHIAYANDSEKGDWVRAAYEGLALRRGDCYVYACTAKELLTRAGIKNMDIEKIPTSRLHFWNLVDIGDGWYHFDTTPRKSDHPRIIMWTEEELMAYSKQHYNSHNYDHSQYPVVS